MLAPIVLFVYNRIEHTRATIDALKKNQLANQSDLLIFSDGPKTGDEESVREIRSYVGQISGFKNIKIYEQEKNTGLANSIISGVTSIVQQRGSVIVLEDDIVTSPSFLLFMNQALDYYKDEKKIWNINAWNYPIKTEGLHDVFIWRHMNCWGWATWADRWALFEKDTDKLVSEFSKEDIKKFDLDGSASFWIQVILNKKNKINTWAVYWYATIFKNNGLCVSPSQTFVKNIGHDGSGVHCGINDSYSSDLNFNNNIVFPTQLIENATALNRVKEFYKKQKKSIFTRAINKLSRLILKKNLIEL
jgi:hypothetical protein